MMEMDLMLVMYVVYNYTHTCSNDLGCLDPLALNFDPNATVE